MRNKKVDPNKRGFWLTTIFKIQSGKCFYCEKEMNLDDANTPDSPTIDHIVPRSEGGVTSIFNLVCACGECNRSKGSTPVIAFMTMIRQRKIRK